MKKAPVVAVIVLLCAPSGFAQSQSSSSSSAASSSQSTSTSNSSSASAASAKGGSATVNESPNFVQAGAGSNMLLVPGEAPTTGGCHPLVNQSLPPLTEEVIDSMARGTKIRRRVVIVDPAMARETYDGPIGIMSYDPSRDHLPGDVIIATTQVPGAYLETNEQLIGGILRKLRRAAPGMRRVALVACSTVKAVTKGHSFGLGGLASGNPGRNIGSSGAIGWSGGRSQTINEKYAVIYAYAMNKGRLNLPSPTPAPPVRNDAPAAVVLPPPASAHAAAAVPTPPALSALAPTMARATPSQPPPPPPVAQCILPKRAIYFGFDCHNVYGRCHAPNVPDPGWQARSEANRKTIALFETYLRHNPECRVTVEGYTDHYGSGSYNAALGLDRANAVYDLLRQDGAILPQVVMSDSNGKNSAAPRGRKWSETNQEDRKVILVIRGASSDPDGK